MISSLYHTCVFFFSAFILNLLPYRRAKTWWLTAEPGQMNPELCPGAPALISVPAAQAGRPSALNDSTCWCLSLVFMQRSFGLIIFFFFPTFSKPEINTVHEWYYLGNKTLCSISASPSDESHDASQSDTWFSFAVIKACHYSRVKNKGHPAADRHERKR